MTQAVALVTGASRGLGAALAEALAPTHHVVAVARTVGGLEELDDRIKAQGGAATLAPIDLTDDNAQRHVFRAIHDRWGRLDLLVHAAVHAPPLSPADHVDERELDRSIALTLRATSRLIAFAAPLLATTAGARAVFFEDEVASSGAPFHGLYGAVKAGQIALARCWQAETRRTGPTVEILTPRPMATALRARFHPGEDRSALAHPRDEAARLLPLILNGA